jgi:hypothetical protein
LNIKSNAYAKFKEQGNRFNNIKAIKKNNIKIKMFYIYTPRVKILYFGPWVFEVNSLGSLL